MYVACWRRTLNLNYFGILSVRKLFSTFGTSVQRPDTFTIDGLTLKTDDMFNLTPTIKNLLERKLLLELGNPLTLVKDYLVSCMQDEARKDGPQYVLVENGRRAVTIFENFDSLLIPKGHVCRSKSDNYYINKDYCLRSHTSAHQHELLKQGLDKFLVVGDVYRRDQIDRFHYPSFHQIEGVHLYSAEDIMSNGDSPDLFIEASERTSVKQETHREIAAQDANVKLKVSLENICRRLFGEMIEMRWVEAYFPFTHPSFELEILYNDSWLEVLGCGIVEQKLLSSAGVKDKVGWAFGIGIERIAMILYRIDDIRLFWTTDTGFLSQFYGKQPGQRFTVKPVSSHPQLINDLSFWIPNAEEVKEMTSNTYDIIRLVGGSLVEQVNITDTYTIKTGRCSQTYRIVYRSNERSLTKREVDLIHREIERKLIDTYGVEIR